MHMGLKERLAAAAKIGGMAAGIGLASAGMADNAPAAPELHEKEKSALKAQTVPTVGADMLALVRHASGYLTTAKVLGHGLKESEPARIGDITPDGGVISRYLGKKPMAFYPTEKPAVFVEKMRAGGEDFFRELTIGKSADGALMAVVKDLTNPDMSMTMTRGADGATRTKRKFGESSNLTGFHELTYDRNGEIVKDEIVLGGDTLSPEKLSAKEIKSFASQIQGRNGLLNTLFKRGPER